MTREDMVSNLIQVCYTLAGHVVRTGKMINAYRILVGKTDGKRPRGRQRLRWKNNFKMDFMRTGSEGVDWSCLA